VLPIFFIIGIALLIFARPLGRFKKQIDTEWKVGSFSEKSYILVARVIGSVFCVISLGIFIVERFSY
jgi:hypothetical protein